MYEVESVVGFIPSDWVEAQVQLLEVLVGLQPAQLLQGTHVVVVAHSVKVNHVRILGYGGKVFFVVAILDFS